METNGRKYQKFSNVETMWLKIKWSAYEKVVWNSFNIGTFCIIKFKSIEVKSKL